MEIGGIRSETVATSFEAQADRYAQRIAIKTHSEQLTYGALNQRANQVAHALIATREYGKPVAVLMDQSAQMIAALLGILKAGSIYMPLDPGHPATRVEYMLDDSRAAVVVTNDAHRSHAQMLGRRIINIDSLDEDSVSQDPGLAITPDAHAWILYTSGSTGQPKGVVQTHRNICRFAENYKHGLGITPEDRYVLVFSCAVNAGAHVIFSALLNGASVYPLDIKKQGVGAITPWLIDNRITLYCSVPTVFRHFVDTLGGGELFPDLRSMIMAGEPVYRRDVEQFKKHFSSHCSFINRLGSSETGTIRWCWVTDATPMSGHNVPVGYPARDYDVLLIDDDGKPVADGQVGEITVRSRYLSPGYWRKEKLTRRVFSDDPDDPTMRIYRTGDLGQMLPGDCLFCLGRKDSQVKIRGHRVEPGEIQHVLLDIPGVKEAFVMGVASGTETRLVAYLVCVDETAPSPTELRQQLLSVLPDYMIPAEYIVMDGLPLAPNGKVDRRALPVSAGGSANQGLVLPQDATEHKVARIWRDVLKLDQIGIHDDFFAMNGNSLLATQVLNAVQTEFGLELPIITIFEAKTIAQFAALIRAKQEAYVSSPGTSAAPDFINTVSRGTRR